MNYLEPYIRNQKGMTRKLMAFGDEFFASRSYLSIRDFWRSKTYQDWKANKTQIGQYILTEQNKLRLDDLIVKVKAKSVKKSESFTEEQVSW